MANHNGIRAAGNGVSVPAYLSGLRARRVELESQVAAILREGAVRGMGVADREAVFDRQREIAGIKKTLRAFDD